MTIRELLHRAGAEEIEEWDAYLDFAPQDRGDWYRSAMIASTIVNVARVQGLGKVPKPVEISDFMPTEHKPVKRKQSAQEQIAMLRALSRSAN